MVKITCHKEMNTICILHPILSSVVYGPLLERSSGPLHLAEVKPTKTYLRALLEIN